MLEETLRAEAQVLHDMLSTHDTDDFMRRLSARIEEHSARPPRVQDDPTRSAPADTSTPPSFSPQRQRSTRPAIRRGLRRRPLPVVTRDPADQPAAALDHLRRLCETVLSAEGAAVLMAAFDHDYDATGACAFACLLYILGRHDSALYWWRFAAGAEDALAAHVLAVYHAAIGTVPEARVWCAHSRLLGYAADQHLPAPLRLSAPPGRDVASYVPTPNNEAMTPFVLNDHLPEGLLEGALARH
ncbi:hypothetical protein [Streptomyces atratus]|uniref:hypothetical protein n=1 Tax=Streptomyces atratus TaxID=1893 RepID=UPI0022536D02|nr:hypothetical protein [Streptomyces atratus]MCX5346076.1 hypothetical protein [Streptomyces atratus]